MHKQIQRFGLAILMVLAGAGVSTAQIDRNRYVVVEARNLERNPQRYWSRGVVFEDALQSVHSRTRRIGGRTYVPIVTKQLSRAYVDRADAALLDRLEEGRAFLFAGTVVSQSGRNWRLQRQTRYYVIIDLVERLVDETDDLLAMLQETAPQQRAFLNVQRAVEDAQNRLVAAALNDGVPVESLFEGEFDYMDPATDLARRAVRHVERELGVTSTEILSLLVRDLLAAQYLDEALTNADISAPSTRGESRPVQSLIEPERRWFRRPPAEPTPLLFDAQDSGEHERDEESGTISIPGQPDDSQYPIEMLLDPEQNDW